MQISAKIDRMSITQELLKKYLQYDPETGLFTWIGSYDQNHKRIGTVAGCVSKTTKRNLKYAHIQIFGNKYPAHRLAFLYMNGKFPDLYIDHINHDGTDNRWCNLREVTNSDNHKNTPKFSNNSSGATGVHFKKSAGMWEAKIKSKYKQFHLGYFKNFDDAVLARKSAEKQHGFHENHGI